MKLSNSLIKLPELSKTMQSMTQEMMKVSHPHPAPLHVRQCAKRHPTGVQAGIMSEMVDDALDGLDENEDELDEEAQEEVDKVLFQITDGKLGQTNGAVGALPVSYHFSLYNTPCTLLTSLWPTAAKERADSRGPREGRGDGTRHRRLAQQLVD